MKSQKNKITNEVDALLKARAEIDEQLRSHKNKMTVLFTDLVGSTSFFERNGDTAGLAMIHHHDELATEIVSQHGGRVVKTIGDSVMAEFPEAGAAVHAAAEIQRQFVKLNATLPQNRCVEVRIGIHTGVGFRKGTDLFGDVVNVAARVTKRSAPAQILISSAVRENVADDAEIKCQWLSTFTLDGRAEKENIYEVVWTDTASYNQLRKRLTVPAAVPSRYEILSQLGTGGTGIVYKARDLETDEIVALKMLKPELASDPAVQENLKRELSLARRITHKNVCRIYELNRSNGQVYTSMELVEGESLLSKLYRSGALPVPEAIDITRQICAGLREAHTEGVIHRDLKPANIMLNRVGTVKIMDFGIARLTRGNGVDNQMTGTIVGTPAYMAPEQAELKPVSFATDIYAIGLVLYEMVTGEPAFAGDTPVAVALKQVRDNPIRPREIVSTLPANIESVILRCLQKDPLKRFQSASDLDSALALSLNKQEPPWKQTVVLESNRFKADMHRFAKSTSLEIRVFAKKNAPIMRAFVSRPIVGIGTALLVTAAGAATVHSGWKNHTHGSAARIEQSMYSLAQSEKRLENQDALTLPKPESATDTRSLPKGRVPSEIEQILDSPDESSPTPPRNPGRSHHIPVPKKQIQPRLTAATDKVQPANSERQSSSATDLAASEKTTYVKASITTDTPVAMENIATGATPPTATLKAVASAVYLEVGTFREELWAANAIEKLTAIGFKASYVQKSKLWMHSYRVQVGPFSDQAEVDEAKDKLLAMGYKIKRIS